MKRRLASLLLVGSLVGCPGPVADGTSDASIKTSTTRMREGLTPEKRVEFDEALQTVALSGLNLESIGGLLKAGQDPEALAAQLRQKLAGKSVDEIIAEAKAIKAEREERHRQEKLKQVDELLKKLAAANDARAVLAKFTIGASRFWFEQQSFSTEPQIGLDVKNDTGHTVSRAFFAAELLTPGREVPWVKAEFNHSISGGLQSGEQAHWQLSPNMFGGFAGAPRDRTDMVLVVSCTKLEGADGKALAEEEFTAADSESLLKLLEETQHVDKLQTQGRLVARGQALAQWRTQEVTRQAGLENERQAQERLQQIAALLKKLDEGEAARQRLAGFLIGATQFKFEKDSFGQASIVMVVTNTTGLTVTRAHFNAEVTTPGREVPWVKSEFNYQIPGGLSTGDTVRWNLSPNMFGDFARVPRDRNDLVLVVSCSRLDGVDEKTLAEDTFSQKDAEGLLSLMQAAQHPDLTAVRARISALQEKAVLGSKEILRQVGLELEALKLKRMSAENAQAQLGKFVVTKSRFYYERTQFSVDPVIELAARNDTGRTVTHVYLSGRVSAPGRETALLVKDLNFECVGGLAAGASEAWKLSPNSFSDWGRLPKDRNDLRLDVTVVGLDGADGKRIFESAPFSEEDQRRWDSLSPFAEASKPGTSPPMTPPAQSR